LAVLVFGVPLGLLLATAAALQSAGFEHSPLGSLGALLLIVGAYMALAAFLGSGGLGSDRIET